MYTVVNGVPLKWPISAGFWSQVLKPGPTQCSPAFRAVQGARLGDLDIGLYSFASTDQIIVHKSAIRLSGRHGTSLCFLRLRVDW